MEDREFNAYDIWTAYSKLAGAYAQCADNEEAWRELADPLSVVIDKYTCPRPSSPRIQKATITSDSDTQEDTISLETDCGTYTIPVSVLSGMMDASATGVLTEERDIDQIDKMTEKSIVIALHGKCPIGKFDPLTNRVTGKPLTDDDVVKLFKDDYNTYCEFCKNRNECKKREAEELKSRAASTYSEEDLRCAWL